MIKIIDLKEKNIFGIKVSGTFNTEDLNNIEADFLKMTAECEEVMMYEDLTELKGF